MGHQVNILRPRPLLNFFSWTKKINNRLSELNQPLEMKNAMIVQQTVKKYRS